MIWLILATLTCLIAGLGMDNWRGECVVYPTLWTEATKEKVLVTSLIDNGYVRLESGDTWNVCNRKPGDYINAYKTVFGCVPVYGDEDMKDSYMWKILKHDPYEIKIKYLYNQDADAATARGWVRVDSLQESKDILNLVLCDMPLQSVEYAMLTVIPAVFLMCIQAVGLC